VSVSCGEGLKGAKVSIDASGKAQGVLSREARDLIRGDDGAVIISVGTYALTTQQAYRRFDGNHVALDSAGGGDQDRRRQGGNWDIGRPLRPELLCNVIDNYYADALLGTCSEDVIGTWARLMQVHQHLVGTVVSEAPPLIEFIPWTQDAFIERSLVRESYLERPQAPGASIAIDPGARSRWQIPGIGSARTA
jgi:hypothetical protein